MRFMMFVKGNKDSEAGVMPSPELIAGMTKYNEEMVKAGVLIDIAGLHPRSQGAIIKLSAGKRTVVDGPFAETKEVVGGYWLIQVNSKAEAIEWAKRVPDGTGTCSGGEGEIELRQVFEPEDFKAKFLPSEVVEKAFELGKQLPARK